MADERPSATAIYDFATWEPLLRCLLTNDAAPSPHGVVSIGRYGWYSTMWRHRPVRDRGTPVRDASALAEPVKRVQSALAGADMDQIWFTLETSPTGRTALHLLGAGPAVELDFDQNVGLGTLVLVDGASPEPARHLPDAMPRAKPSAAMDLATLDQTLRDRLPNAIGATDGEIATAEARLGITLPDELKVLYRVARARWEDWRDTFGEEAVDMVSAAIGYELFALESLYIVNPRTRSGGWALAKTAVNTPPDAAVQGLVCSPGWIAFAHNGGDQIAVDLTPGPRGHIGQIILIDHEEIIGAKLVANSLTELVSARGEQADGGPDRPSPAVARVDIWGGDTIEAAVHPDLEVLTVSAWDQPVSLASVTELPRLRTLIAYPGTLADPLEVTNLTGLEFLGLGPDEWRTLLDAGAVPRTLLAATITVDGNQDGVSAVDVANELLALWDRPQISRTVIEGDLS